LLENLTRLAIIACSAAVRFFGALAEMSATIVCQVSPNTRAKAFSNSVIAFSRCRWGCKLANAEIGMAEARQTPIPICINYAPSPLAFDRDAQIDEWLE